MNCPGCGATIGRFRAAGEAGERVGGVTCVRDGMEYELQQVISQPAASGAEGQQAPQKPKTQHHRPTPRRRRCPSCDYVKGQAAQG
jgi:hypothetical protein